MNKRQQRRDLKEDFGKIKSDNFDFSQIELYFRRDQQKERARQVISDKTMDDLDFQELFKILDRTTSKVGQQYLFRQLLTFSTSTSFSKQEERIDSVAAQEGERVNSQLLLSKLDDYDAYNIASLFQDEYVSKPDWYRFLPFVSFTAAMCFVFVFLSARLFLIPLIALYIINLLIHYRNKRYIYTYISSIPQLKILCEISSKLLKKHPDSSVEKALKSIIKMKHRIGLFGTESRSNSEIVLFFLMIIEHVKIFFLIEPLVVFNVLNELDKKREEIRKLFVYVGEIDAALSIASLRSGLPYVCQPVFASAPRTLQFDGIYHPLIDDCIPNSLQIEDKSILLTGSNMSGKTSFIRSVAINVLCAQTINTCFARSMQLCPMQLFSAIRISDDVLQNKSFYFEEVNTIKEMVDQCVQDVPKLFLMDEIFKGTNTAERIAAGKAVLSYLSGGNNIVFVSTHDIELSDLLTDQYSLYHFTEVIENNVICFDYKLKPGNLATRNAIRILELNGYPNSIIEEAQRLLETKARENS